MRRSASTYLLPWYTLYSVKNALYIRGGLLLLSASLAKVRQLLQRLKGMRCSWHRSINNVEGVMSVKAKPTPDTC